VIVYHADRLHVRINQGRTNKTESPVCTRGNADEPLARLSSSESFGPPLALTFPDTSLFIKVVKRLERKIDERLRSSTRRIAASR